MSSTSVWRISFKALTVDSVRYFAWSFCDIWHMVYTNKKSAQLWALCDVVIVGTLGRGAMEARNEKSAHCGRLIVCLWLAVYQLSHYVA